MLDPGRFVQVTPSLSLFQIPLRLLQLTIDNARDVDGGLLVLPLRL